MLNEEECMHLEKYSTLCPSAQNELEYRLQQAEDEGDVNEQALIHSGICSLEAAITAYVKKYAKTKKSKIWWKLLKKFWTVRRFWSRQR